MTLPPAARLLAQDVGFGNALSFNGASQFVRIPQPFIPTNGDFTIECWVNATIATGAFREILSQGQAAVSPRFYLGLEPGGTIRAGDNWSVTGVVLPSNSWHHLALSRTAGNAFLYLDGALAATKGSVLSNASTAPFADIGQQFQNGGEFWLGGIDDVRVWNTARSQGQIRANMNHAIAGNESNLVAYYRFDASSGTVAANSATATGAALNGSLSNAPAWIPSGAVFALFADTTTNVLDGVTNTATGNVFLGSNAPNTTLLLTNAAVLANTADGTLGFTTNAFNNRVTVTGSGSVWSNGGSLFVGQSGSFNTLVVSNGGRVTAIYGFIGNADGASNNQAIVTGTDSRLELSAFLSVGANGSGRSNSLLITNGGVVANAGIGYIGFASTNSAVTVIGAGSLWTNGTELRVGESGVGNTLLIANGGRVENTTGIIGLNAAAASNQVTVRGNNSLWNNSAGLVVGDAGSFNSLLLTNGGKVVNTLGVIGRAATATGNQVVLRGAESRWSNSVGLVVGDAGSFNSLWVTNSATVLSAGDSVVGAAAGANSNEVRLLNAGSTWFSGGQLVVGNLGSGNLVLVTNGAALTNLGVGSIGRGAGANGNQVLITGSGSTWRNFGSWVDVGESGSGSSLIVSNGGQAFGNSAYVSTFVGASNNLVVVTGTNSLWQNSGDLFVGLSGSKATLRIDNGGAAVNNNGTLGALAGSRDTLVLVEGAGSQWINNGALTVGESGFANTVSVSNGGSVTVSGPATLGRLASSSNNVAVFTGAGSVGNFSELLLVGDAGSGNQLIVSNGAQVSAAFNILGNSPAGRSNSALVTGAGSRWTAADGVIVGFEGAGSRLTISNGGRVDGPFGVLGYRTTSSDNTALISGPGTAWTNSESLYVGYDGPGNQLILSNGARLVSGTAAIGFSSSSTNNSVVIAGTGSEWTNSGTLSVGRLGAGSLTLNGGTLHAGQLLLTNGSRSQFTFNGGTLVTRGATIASLTDFVVGATSNFPAATWEPAGNTPSSVANNLFVGAGGASGARLFLTNGGALAVGIQSVIGRAAASSNNLGVVSGAGSLWSSASHFFIGDSGAANTLVITNGGRVENAEGYLGLAPGANNNRVIVTGSNSVWNNSGFLYVGNAGSSNSLLITNGGAVQATRVRVGFTVASAGNLLTVAGGSLTVSNEFGPATPAELDVRRGGVVLSGGAITADRLLLTNGAPGQFTFSAGTLNVRTAAVANAAPFIVGNGSSAATYRMTGAPTSTHAFANGLLLSTNATLTGNGTIAGNVTNFGALLPGTGAGALRINGDLRLRPSAGLTFEIGGLIATNDYDQVTVTNFVEFAGALSLTLLNGYVPGGSDSFTLMKFGSRAGTFANAAHGARLNTSDNLYSFLVSYSATNLVVGSILPVGGAALPPDSDGDGQSDLAEQAAGTDPNDSTSALAVLTMSCHADGCIAVRFQFASDRSYRIEYSNDLVEWRAVAGATLTSPAAGLGEWVDDGSLTGGLPEKLRFYRVCLQ
jgi:T5SS/PEP-CTERM-associated repeat protein